jgi:acetyltransferase-like isoleucine patch superfamily enzyme
MRKIIRQFEYNWHKRTSFAYLNYLRSKGIKIGQNCIFRDARSARIDETRPSLITIGDNVDMNKNFQILTHDWGSHVFIRKYNDFIPAHRRVDIGNNIYFGTNCIILAGAKIGDNCIIGACSMVNNEIPANSVVAGAPAKVICSIDKYYEKRKIQYIEEILDYAQSIQERFSRRPVIADFYDDYPAFVDGNNFDKFDYPYFRVFNEEQFNIWKHNHKAHFKSFEEFLDAAGIK